MVLRILCISGTNFCEGVDHVRDIMFGKFFIVVFSCRRTTEVPFNRAKVIEMNLEFLTAGVVSLQKTNIVDPNLN